MTLKHSAPLALDPPFISGLIVPVQTEGAVGGVNYHLLHINENGLLVQIQPYLNMQEGDWIAVYWGDASAPVAGDRVLDEHVGANFSLFIRANRIPDGVSEVWFTVTRSGGENGGESTPIGILVRTEAPGGIDPEPDVPGHQDLPAPVPELPPSGIIDEEAAKNGVKVTFSHYPNMRVYDVITFSWGGVLLTHEVTQAEVDAGTLDILVSEATILAAGDSDDLVLVYRVRDEVHNPSSEWSLRTLIHVEVGKGLFDAPIIENPDPAADPYDVIDLDVLGDADLLVEVQAPINGSLQVDDMVKLTWVGTTAQGEPVPVEQPEQTVARIPMTLKFHLPNADLLALGGGRGVASYSVTRDGSPAGPSKRTFASFLGAERKLPKPSVVDAVDGVLDPTLASTIVIVPGEALVARDTVRLTWLGIRANGTPLLWEITRGVSDGGAGKPMSFSIDGAELIAPLDGGSLSVYYTVIKENLTELESEREQLSVGEARAELPAPFTRPPAENGVLDPADLPGQLEVVIAPYPGMTAEQKVHLLWRASSGPQHDDSMSISAPMVGHEVVFYLDRARVEENLGATIQLSYRVESPGEPSQVSGIAAFVIEARRAILPLPLILEAEGDRLDPNDVTDGASVHIDASAQLQEDDLITVHIVSDAEGGSIDVPWTVPIGGGGQPATITVPYDSIAASIGTRISVHYSITRAAGGPVELSGTVGYSVYSEIDAGALQVMGARFNASIWWAGATPRMLSALHADSLTPMLVEWRYEDSQQWTAGRTWTDTRPWLKLYVRSSTETWECRAANIFGNGYPHHVANGGSAFVAMRDEVMGDNGSVVDLVGWGNTYYGGNLAPHVIEVEDVAEVSANSYSFSARLSNGNAVNWGHENHGAKPPLIESDFVQIRGNRMGFIGRTRDGELQRWGHTPTIPQPILQHRDYVEVYGASHAFAARRASGHVVAWGDTTWGGQLHPGQDQFNDIVHVAGNLRAFAALRERGGLRSVIAWGHIDSGGSVPEKIAELTNVRALVSAGAAFCVLLDTGEVKAWPETNDTGTVPYPIARLTNVVEVTASLNAFCARLSTGQVVAWGYKDWGGELSQDAADASNIVQVTGNTLAFAALRSDGTVVAWGNPQPGGDTSGVAHKLVDVRAIYGNTQAFTALTADGQVVTWGVPVGGGDSEKVQPELVRKVTHSRQLSLVEAEVVAQGGSLGRRRG
ncbi:RCC1 domain-containing protein [Pseudomonas japonica]|uniref:RCC1 domain-containing protein n=1 Tax=Pseudomonas japonica TaxID=256466 RepID=UPI00382E3F89